MPFRSYVDIMKSTHRFLPPSRPIINLIIYKTPPTLNKTSINIAHRVSQRERVFIKPRGHTGSWRLLYSNKAALYSNRSHPSAVHLKLGSSIYWLINTGCMACSPLLWRMVIVVIYRRRSADLFNDMVMGIKYRTDDLSMNDMWLQEVCSPIFSWWCAGLENSCFFIRVTSDDDCVLNWTQNKTKPPPTLWLIISMYKSFNFQGMQPVSFLGLSV